MEIISIKGGGVRRLMENSLPYLKFILGVFLHQNTWQEKLCCIHTCSKEKEKGYKSGTGEDGGWTRVYRLGLIVIAVGQILILSAFFRPPAKYISSLFLCTGPSLVMYLFHLNSLFSHPPSTLHFPWPVLGMILFHPPTASQ